MATETTIGGAFDRDIDAPSCTSCWLARCVMDMSGVASRKLADALRVVRLFAGEDLTPGRPARARFQA